MTIKNEELDANCQSLAKTIGESFPGPISGIVIFLNRDTGYIAAQSVRMDSPLARRVLSAVVDKIDTKPSLIIPGRA